MYEIEIVPSAMAELRRIPAHFRRAIEDNVERRLAHAPRRISRRIKCLKGLAPGFEYVEPIWQLRVGEWRVFYDIDEMEMKVCIRAVRRKPVYRTTEEIV